MAQYTIRYIHKIQPRDTDVETRELPDVAFSDRNTLGKALRRCGVLSKGARVLKFRVEGDKTIAFPSAGIWHSIIITPSR
jgi:hypothetical protein